MFAPGQHTSPPPHPLGCWSLVSPTQVDVMQSSVPIGSQASHG